MADRVEQVKEILEAFGNRVKDILIDSDNSIVMTVAKLCRDRDETAKQIVPLFEPQADEDRLLTDEDFAEEQRKYMEENHLFCFPLEGWRRDDCNRKAQDAKTAVAKDAEWEKKLTVNFERWQEAAKIAGSLIIANYKAECQARVRKIFGEIGGHYVHTGTWEGIRLNWFDWQALKEECLKEGVE